jgi:hypothetical protein
VVERLAALVPVALGGQPGRDGDKRRRKSRWRSGSVRAMASNAAWEIAMRITSGRRLHQSHGLVAADRSVDRLARHAMRLSQLPPDRANPFAMPPTSEPGATSSGRLGMRYF